MNTLEYFRDTLKEIIKNQEKSRESLFDNLNCMVVGYSLEYDKTKKTFDSYVRSIPLFESKLLNSIASSVDKKSEERIALVFKESSQIERPYDSVYHYKHFTRNFHKKEHYVLEIDPKDIIDFENSSVVDINYVETIVEKHKNGDILNEEEYHTLNQLDQYYFKNKTNKLLLIPIPVLSSPVIYLAFEYVDWFNNINEEDGKKNLKDLVEHIYNLTKLTTRYHIYNTLLRNLSKQIEERTLDRIEDLVKMFSIEIAKILMPKSLSYAQIIEDVKLNDGPFEDAETLTKRLLKCMVFKSKEACNSVCQSKIDRGKEVNCTNCRGRRLAGNGKFGLVKINNQVDIPVFDEWKSPYDDYYKIYFEKENYEGNYEDEIVKYDHRFIFTLTLNAEKHDKQFLLTFKETSFVLPEKIDGDEKNWVRKLPDYSTSAQQLQGMLGNIFNLIYNQWINKKKAIDATKVGIVTQILARNYAHHIGSHVINRVRSKELATLWGIKEDIEIDFDLSNVRGNVQKVKKLNDALISGDDESFINYCKGYEISFKISHELSDQRARQEKINDLKDKLDEYCQHRNEYLADISEISNTGGKTSFFFRDILKPFLENELLLDNIAASEGLCYNSGQENQLKINIFKKNENKLFLIENNDYEWNRNDFEVIIPSSLGMHSFYSILENIIRNSAKHNKEKLEKSKRLDINIVISDKDREYSICIYDNVSLFNNKQFNDFNTNIKKAFKIVDNDGIPLNECTGILDMAVNATILQNSNDYSRENLLKSLIVGRTGDKENNCCLCDECTETEDGNAGYLFFKFNLLKPHNINLLISNDVDLAIQKKLEFFKNKGIAINDLSNNKYKFYIVDEKLIGNNKKVDSLLDEKKYCRIFVLKNLGTTVIKHPNVIYINNFSSKIQTKLRDYDFGEYLLNCCWKLWIKKRFKKRSNISLKIYIDDQTLRNRCLKENKWKYDSKKSFSLLGEEIVKQKKRNKLALFDHHGTYHSEMDNEHKNYNMFSNDNFYSVINKNTLDFNSIIYSKNNSNLKYELIEAAFLNVLIIDERITEKADKKYSGKIRFDDIENDKFFHSYLCANTFVCSKLIVKNEQKTKTIRLTEEGNNNLEVKLTNSRDKGFSISYNSKKIDLSVLAKNIDFLILHRTLLHKNNLCGMEPDVFMSKIRKIIPYVIIDSGGGSRNSTINKDYGFLPFANLSSCFKNNEIAKYNLISNLI